MNDLIIGDRRGVLHTDVWTTFVPVWRAHGSAAVEAIINSIDDFDRRFLDTKLLAETYSTPGSQFASGRSWPANQLPASQGSRNR